jgi:hypothetical protein
MKSPRATGRNSRKNLVSISMATIHGSGGAGQSRRPGSCPIPVLKVRHQQIKQFSFSGLGDQSLSVFLQIPDI